MNNFRQMRFYQNFAPSVRKLSMANRQEIPSSVNKYSGRRMPSLMKGKALRDKVPIIICKREELNHYKGQTYNKFDVVPLASKAWNHRKSKGDFFEIKKHGDVPEMNIRGEKSFESLGISNDCIQVLQDKGFSHPTQIQEDGIASILKGRNTLLAAETGSGKTFAYLLPLLTQISVHRTNVLRETLNSPFGLIISPSRELTEQIGENAKYFSENLGINVAVITGGHTKRMIMSPSFTEVDLVVSSLGVLSKLINTGIYRTSHVQHVVVDEADTLLDDSFNSNLLRILRRFSFVPESTTENEKPCVQITLAASTIPTSMSEILGESVPVDTLHRVTSKKLHYIQPHVSQKFFRIGRSSKAGTLLQIVKSSANRGEPVMIFSNKTPTCDWISLFLNENNVKCINLNGDMKYEIRVGKFKEFQNGEVNVLSCTDMGSNGLDTVRVKHILNYDFPIYMSDYIHRCGRTGRVGSPEDCHITNFICSELEIQLVQKIEFAMRKGEPLANVNANIKRIIENKYYAM